MPVTVRYWAGARRAAGTPEERLTARDLADLRAQLVDRPVLGPVVAASSLLVDGVAPPAGRTDLPPGAVVDVLPPFAGG